MGDGRMHSNQRNVCFFYGPIDAQISHVALHIGHRWKGLNDIAKRRHSHKQGCGHSRVVSTSRNMKAAYYRMSPRCIPHLTQQVASYLEVIRILTV